MYVNFGKIENTNEDYKFPVSEISNTLISGDSRTGKTVAAMKIISESIKAQPAEKRFVCMTSKTDWRALAQSIEPENFHLINLGVSDTESDHFNPCIIPYGVDPQEWTDVLVENFCRTYGLLAVAKNIISDAIHDLYANAGVFEAMEKSSWKDIVPELSKKVTFKEIYKELESRQNTLDDSKEGIVIKNTIPRLLERLSPFGRDNSIESKIFGSEDSIGINDLAKIGGVIVLESAGLELTLSNFIFSVITSGFYQYGKAQEGGYKAPDQRETVLVIEEADKVFVKDEFGLNESSKLEEVFEKSANHGLYVMAITQKLANLPSSLTDNAEFSVIGKQRRRNDVDVAAKKLNKEYSDVCSLVSEFSEGKFVCRKADSEPVVVTVAS